VIWFLSLINLSFVLILLRSAYKKPSILVFALASSIVVFLVRPFAVLVYGSTIITESFYSEMNYELGLAVATAFHITFYGALILFYHKKYKSNNLRKVELIEVSNNSIILTLAMCILFLIGFLFVGGIDVLFVNRFTSISVVAPSLRYIYPFAVVFLCIGAMQGAILYSQNRVVLGIALLLFYLVASMILAQRGFFIIFVVVGVTLCLRVNRVSIKSYVSQLFPFAFILMAAVSSKQFLVSFFSSEQSFFSAQNTSLSEKILSSPDGDTTEVWMLATKFVNENGYLFGSSVVNNIFNVFTHNQRREWGVMNGSDVLNGEYTGEGYWDLGFGFNVQLPIELYINFGIFGLILICFFGIILGMALRQFDGRVIFQGRDPSWEVLRLYAIYTFCNSLAGLQWSLLFFAFYFVSRLRWRGDSSSKSIVNSS